MTNVSRIAIAVDSTQVRQARSDLGGMQQNALLAQSGVKGVGKQLAALAAGALTLQAVGRAMSSVVSTTMRFEDVMLGLEAVSRATTEQMALLEAQARSLGATTKFSADQAGAAQRFLAQAGFDVNEVLGATPGVLTLAVAGQLDLARAADIASNVLGGMRLEVDQLNRVNNTLASTAAGSNTSIEQLGHALSFAAPFAATAGIEIETAAAAIGVLSDAGLQGSRAGTGLMGVIRQLSRVTPEAEKVLRKYGLTTRDVNIELHGLETVLDRVRDANMDVTDTFTVFGSEAGAAAGVLAAGAGRVREFTREINEAEDSAQKMADVIGSGLSNTMASFSSAVSEATLQLGESGLIAAFRTVIETSTGVITVFNGMQAQLIESGAATQDQVELYESLATAAEVVTVLVGIRLSAAIGVGLVRALGASRGAMGAAIAQNYAYQTALAKTTGASLAAIRTQTALATAVTGARGAMALLGGPTGIAMLAAYGIWEFASSMRDAENAARGMGEELDKLTSSALQSAIAAQEDHLVELQKRLAPRIANIKEDIEEGFGSLRHRENLEKYNKELADAEAHLKDLHQALRDASAREYQTALENLYGGTKLYNEALEREQRQLKLADKAQSDLSDEHAEGADEVDALTVKVEDYVLALQMQLLALGKTDRQLAIHNALVRSSTMATGQHTAAEITAIDAYYDAKDALDEKTRAQREAAEEAESALLKIERANEEAAQAMIRDWQNVRQSFGEFFADLVTQGDNAFDALLKSWERTALQMAGNKLFDMGAQMAGLSIPGGTGATSYGAFGSVLSAGAGKLLPGLTKPGAVITDAELQQLLGGKSTGAGGLNLTDLKSIGLSMGAGIAGGFAGNAVGEGIFGKQAESQWGATAGGTAGAMIGGPLGAFIGSAIGSMVDVALGGDGKLRSNAGFLAAPTPGLKQEYDAGSHTFASGLEVKLFARRADTQAARDILRTFDEVDRTFVDLVKELGGNVSVSQLTGLDEEANRGSKGAFFGLGGNGTTQGDILAQLNSYVSQLTNNVSGLSDELIDSVRNAQSAEEALAVLTNELMEQEVAANKTARAAEQARVWSQIMNETIIRNTDTAFKQLEQAIRNEQSLLRAGHNETIKGIREETQARLDANALALEAARDGLQAIRQEMTGLENAADALRGTFNPVREAFRKTALETLRNAMVTGDLTGTGEAARIAGQNLSAGNFANADEFRREQARTLFLIGSLEKESRQQERVAENAVKGFERMADQIKREADARIGAEEERHRSEMNQLDNQLTTAQEQLGVLRGIDGTLLSLLDAMRSFSAAISREQTYVNSIPETRSPYSGAEITDYYETSVRSGRTPQEVTAEIRGRAINENISADDVAGSLGWTRKQLDEHLDKFNVPRFNLGGSHTGGLRVVGESGMELESTGPSRISSNDDLRKALGANAELLAEIKNQHEYLRATAKSSVQMRDWMDRLRREGYPTRPVEELE